MNFVTTSLTSRGGVDSCYPMDAAEKLARKIARAERKGDAARVAELKARQPAHSADASDPRPASEPAEEEASRAREAKLQRKLLRAEASGNEERAALLRLKLAALRGGDAGHDEAAEAGFHAAAAASAAAATAAAAAAAQPAIPEGMVLGKNGQLYPKPAPLPPGNTTLLLFYAYVQPPWAPRARTEAIAFAQGVLTEQGCTGRLRVALEGFNGTLTGPQAGVRAFCEALRAFSPQHFGATDFKLVDGLQDSKRFRTLKVWPVEELVTYGFSAAQAPLASGGKHVKPEEWTELAARGDTVMVDVRNANESAIGRFAPPPGGAVLLDPRMRRSTEFADWVDKALPQFEGKTVMMYCTGGVRWCVCARAPFSSHALSTLWEQFFFYCLTPHPIPTPSLYRSSALPASARLRCLHKRACPGSPLCSWRGASTATWSATPRMGAYGRARTTPLTSVFRMVRRRLQWWASAQAARSPGSATRARTSAACARWRC